MSSSQPDRDLNQLVLVFVVSTLGQTGPTRQLFNIIKFLETDRILVNLITLSPEPKQTLKPEFETLNIPIYSLGLNRLAGLQRGARALKNLLATLNPDIIHTQGIRADLLSAGLSEYTSRLTTQRNIPEEDYPLLYQRLPGTILAQLHRRALKRIPYVVACSSPIAQDNKDRGMETQVIHNGVDLTWCPQLPSRRQKLSAATLLKLDQDDLVFIYAGPMIERKNPLFLIESFLGWDRNSKNHLILLGDGPMAGQCRHLANNYPNVTVKGHISDITNYLRAADVFISASSSEGFPNAVLEALAFGLSMVLSDIPSHREIIDTDARIGHIYQLKNRTAFCRCLNVVNPTDYTRQASRLLAESQYSGKTMAKRYKALYESICSNKQNIYGVD